MDKCVTACYTLDMPLHRIPLILLSALFAGAVAGASPSAVTRADVESMYEQARAMLEGRSIQNVESVRLLLETCVRELLPEANRLLMDVFEGKFRGLKANPEQANRLARGLAESAKLDRMKSEYRDLRTDAMFRLALYLEKGYGCEEDKAEACHWMQAAAERGMPEARAEYARYLMLGTGVQRDPGKAWDLLHTLAIKHPETPNVFFYMGHMCAQGIGMPRNSRKAFELIRMGAKMKDARCLNNLGSMFEKGYPAPRNPEYAYQLYRMAANLGNREASANMQRLAFKEGIRASSRSSTPVRTRIDNATLHLIRALPVTEETRDRLRYWLLLENHSSNS